MKYKQKYHSYMVRLWQDELPQEGAAAPRWQGELVHIQTGKCWQVDDQELLSVLIIQLEGLQKVGTL